ncbi:MAG: hypothetical protein MUO77_08310, partial [Anaerolineales bacterium]|nr:hypothetical protein [Anaerolineales bacterium]
PQLGEPEVASWLRATDPATGEHGYYLVQLSGPPTDARKTAIETTGATLIAYMPDDAYIVRATTAARDAMIDSDAVNWAGLYHPAYKLSPTIGAHEFVSPDRAGDSFLTLMVRVFDAYFNAIDGRKNMRGGEYHINLLPTTCHIYFGAVTGATPDGRKAWTPLSEGVSPVQGADRNGPTAAVRSVAKMDHVRTGGTLLNQKFTPQVLANDEGLDKLVSLVRGYFKLDGHHIQFNVVDAKTLKAAQTNPEQYRSLIVRVAGYSDYFCDLSKTFQDEIISRTEHEGF